ncbi:MAG: MinD-like protein [Betaproteobacteria bacterium HGW-Betaproteobacteria-6]|nr:MAG: MinD-like protein [Betaproteobacteria bacterium HGW-Betaproteobacteria-6]
MADFCVDQAAGLRRLLGGGAQLQVITFVAGCDGVGRSVAVANIGVALARLGKEVLIIDEHAAGDDIASMYGMSARHDLLNVVQREMPLSHVLLQPMLGLRVLPAARAVRKLGRLSLLQQQTLLNAMSGLERPFDVILVDASVAHPNGFSPFGLVAQEAVVVLSGSSASITEAYSLIKKVSHAFSRKHFRILVNKVRSQSDARSIFENIAQVAAQRGVAQLDYAGAIPLDEALRQAAQLCRPVVIQAPDSLAAAAFRDVASDMLYWQRSECEAGGVGQFMQQLLHLSQRITPNVLRA